jgi:hypothetical protein
VLLAMTAIGRWIPAFGKVLEETQFYAWAILAIALLLAGTYIQKNAAAGARRFRFVQPMAGRWRS